MAYHDEGQAEMYCRLIIGISVAPCIHVCIFAVQADPWGSDGQSVSDIIKNETRQYGRYLIKEFIVADIESLRFGHLGLTQDNDHDKDCFDRQEPVKCNLK